MKPMRFVHISVLCRSADEAPKAQIKKIRRRRRHLGLITHHSSLITINTKDTKENT